MRKHVHVTRNQMFKYFPADTQCWWISKLGHPLEVRGIDYDPRWGEQVMTDYGSFHITSADVFLVSPEDAAKYLPK